MSRYGRMEIEETALEGMERKYEQRRWNWSKFPRKSKTGEVLSVAYRLEILPVTNWIRRELK